MKTIALCESLIKSGYSAKLINTFSYAQNKQYDYFAILIYVDGMSLAQITELVKIINRSDRFFCKLEIMSTGEPIFSIQRQFEYAELIEQDGINYSNKNILAVEKNQTVAPYSFWLEIYSNATS